MENSLFDAVTGSAFEGWNWFTGAFTASSSNEPSSDAPPLEVAALEASVKLFSGMMDVGGDGVKAPLRETYPTLKAALPTMISLIEREALRSSSTSKSSESPLLRLLSLNEALIAAVVRYETLFMAIERAALLKQAEHERAEILEAAQAEAQALVSEAEAKAAATQERAAAQVELEAEMAEVQKGAEAAEAAERAARVEAAAAHVMAAAAEEAQRTRQQASGVLEGAEEAAARLLAEAQDRAARVRCALGSGAQTMPARLPKADLKAMLDEQRMKQQAVPLDV